MIFSYQARQNLKRVLTVLLHCLIVAVAMVLCCLLWLQRFVVYTDEGVRLDFDLPEITEAVTAPQRPTASQIPIEYVDEKTPIDTPQEDEVILQQWLDGYYIDVYTLIADPMVLVEQLEALPAGTPILVDIKSYFGYYYYSSTLGSTTSQSNVAQVDAFFAYLAESDLYTIARFPALRDYDFADKNYSCAIWKTNGSVYQDANRSLWLDPSKDATLGHLIQIIKELRDLGFDEVVLQDFQIPAGDDINYTNRTEALETAAQALVTACASDQFLVSFVASEQFTKIPESRSRLYLMQVAAADVAEIIASAQLTDPERQVVIIAETYDTRYEVGNTLHPLDQAH